MTDPIVSKVEQKVEAVVTSAKAEATKAEAAAASEWLKVKPWLTHALAVVAGYVVSNVGVVEALIKKLL